MSEVRPRRAEDRRGELLGSLLTVAMALQFAFVVVLGKSLLHGQLPFALLALRFAGTAVILAVLLALTGRPLLPERGERLGIVIAGSVGYGTESAFYFAALNHGNAAAVTLLFYTYPVIVMLATIAKDREAPVPMLFVALGLAVAGTAAVVVGGAGVEIEVAGIVLALCCAIAYSGYLIGADHVLRRTDPMTAALWLACSASFANLVYAAVFRAASVPGGGGDRLRVVGMAAFTAGAFICMLAGLQRIGAVRNAIIGVLEPLAVAFLGLVLLQEPLSASTLIGGGLILGGAVVATLVRTTRVREPDV